MVEKRKLDIIKELAENLEVEQIISNITKINRNDFADLAQDIYTDLMEMSDDKLFGMYDKKQLNYYIVRMVFNNCFSQTSRYYYKYRRFLNNSERIEELYDKV